MPSAKRIEQATLSFLLTGIAPLEKSDAMLAICAALTADGHVEHSRRVFDFLLKDSDHPDPEHMREAILQTHLFAGYPRALNALAAFKDACKAAGNPLSGEIKLRSTPLEAEDMAVFRQRGGKLFAMLYGNIAPKIDQIARDGSPDLGEWALVEGYGRVLARDVLKPQQRSLCIVAALMPLDVLPQLKGHVQGALNLGNKPETLWKLYEVLPKLFDHMPKSAKTAFEAVLGKQQISDDQFEQEQKYKWS
jgi:alkylhydroperoxidase/carboxymuconolactone decarboxylase family protein YurZ